MKTAIICYWLLLLPAFLLADNFTRPCSKEDAIRADTGASTLKDWTEVYIAYKQFAQCDDGGIGEGYSESIARLLSNRWSAVGGLNRLTSRDKGFEKFVLRHVDETMSPTEAKAIRRNAEDRCPSGAKRVCDKIRARLKEIEP